jgi:hypothetical protein
MSVKSKQRVADHGEVFTPDWLVENMLDLVKNEADRIDSRFLEPACGNGNFLTQVLKRKLAAVEVKYGRSEFDRRHFALLGLMCIYGIEILEDNVDECRSILLDIFCDYLALRAEDDLSRAANLVISLNIVCGNALSMKTKGEEPICFAEWGYLGKGKFQRRDFRYDLLTGASAYSAEDSLFANLGKDDIFSPIKTHEPMNISQLADSMGY